MTGAGFPASLPRVVRLKQRLVSQPMDHIAERVRDQVMSVAFEQARPGASVAVGCSSRGIANYREIVGAVVDALKLRGSAPFIFPAMGSHGAATAEGQRAVLARAGITEDTMGCPVRSSLAVRQVGTLATGMPVVMDGHAYDADAFVVVNRVRSHTEFTAPFESGLMKMIAVGMGKEFGATVYHKYFLRHGYAATIEKIVELVMHTRPLLFGVGIIEDGYASTAGVRVIRPAELITAEAALLDRARAMTPRLPFDDLDVLVIDEMGKDISGSGFDTKVVGRLAMPLLGADPERPRIKRIAVLDLTDTSAGNADGVGIADFISARLRDKIDVIALYVNALAGSEPEHARLPMVLDSDREAIAAAAATIGPVAPTQLRLVRISNTRDLGEMEISEALVSECVGRSELILDPSSHPLPFTAAGELKPLAAR